MIMTKQSIGGLTFFRNPKSMTPPESKITTAELATYTGNALFLWPAILEGVKPQLKWEWMIESDFQALRAMQLTLSAYLWTTGTAFGNFNVVIVGLEGELVEHALTYLPYRENVVCTLNIRSAA